MMVAPVVSAAAAAGLRKMVEQMAKKKAAKAAKTAKAEKPKEDLPLLSDRVTGSRAAKDYKENAPSSRTKEVTGELRFGAPRKRDRDDFDRSPRMSDDMKKGGKVKKYAAGGSVRGSGIEMRGTRKCKIV
jgi:hypothetical protein